MIPADELARLRELAQAYNHFRAAFILGGEISPEDDRLAAQFQDMNHADTILRLLDALEQVTATEREACARIAESKFARIHTFASENSDRYIAMRDAGNAIAEAIRHRAADAALVRGEREK